MTGDDMTGGGTTPPARTAWVAATGSLLAALSAPVRIGIALELADGPCYVHGLAERLGVRESLVSQHLRILRTAGLVTCDREGFRSAYRLTDPERTAQLLRLAREASHVR